MSDVRTPYVKGNRRDSASKMGFFLRFPEGLTAGEYALDAGVQGGGMASTPSGWWHGKHTLGVVAWHNVTNSPPRSGRVAQHRRAKALAIHAGARARVGISFCRTRPARDA